MIEFAHPAYFLLLLLLIPYLLWQLMFQKKSEPTMSVSDASVFHSSPVSWRVRLIPLPLILRVLAYVLIVTALARPQTSNAWQNKSIEGIDIMLAVDVSTSMLAEDLKPNRIEAAKQVATEFINGRPNDNIGLTVFAGEAFTQCPMPNAVARLKQSKAKSKVVILLTDGSNNMGDLSPMTAAEIAKSFGVRVYTIGVGTNKLAPYPMPVAGGVQYVNIPVEIDTKTLRDIALATDGNFYRATNTRELHEIYKEIDQLEKTKLNVKKFSKRYEIYQPFVLIAFLLLVADLLLRLTLLRRIP